MRHNSNIARKEMHPMPSGIMHPMSSGIHPFSSGVVYPVPSGVIHPLSSGITRPAFSGAMCPWPLGVFPSLAAGVMGPVPPSRALIYPNDSLNVPATPVTNGAVRSINQKSKYFHQQAGTISGPLFVPGSNLEQNRNSKHLQKSELFSPLSIMNTPLAKDPKRVTSSSSAGVSVPASTVETPCLSLSAPAVSNLARPQLSSKNTSPVKSVSHSRPLSLDVTPKRKTEKRLAKKSRRQKQADNVSFAGAKFSESPQAKVVPLPPFIWCEESSSSSSCSGDEQSTPSIEEVMKVSMSRHEKFHEPPTWDKCSTSLQVTSLQRVAVLPSS